jgi:proteasome lid subunit RPN8/RPN11
MKLQIPTPIYYQLLEQARNAYPLEIVGILAGTNQEMQILPLENIAANPDREYMADPESLLHALKHLRTQNLELLALYHSHPNGPAKPSRTDFLEAKWDVPMLIVDAKNEVIRAWQLENGQEVFISLI